MARVSTVFNADDPMSTEDFSSGCEVIGTAGAQASDRAPRWGRRRRHQTVPPQQPRSHDRPESGVILRLESILRPSASAPATARAGKAASSR
jgi:hypothetical protein